MSISSKNNDHLQRKANNCLNSIVCVPSTKKNVAGRKLSDEDIHKLARVEGKFLRLIYVGIIVLAANYESMTVFSRKTN